MSPNTKLQRQLRHLVTAFVIAGVAALGFLTGQIVGRVPVEESDLVAGGVNSCVTAIKASLALLDSESVIDFNDAQVEELRRLPDRCHEEAVGAALQEDFPALLEALETVGTDSP